MYTTSVFIFFKKSARDEGNKAVAVHFSTTPIDVTDACYGDFMKSVCPHSAEPRDKASNIVLAFPKGTESVGGVRAPGVPSPTPTPVPLTDHWAGQGGLLSTTGHSLTTGGGHPTPLWAAAGWALHATP